MHALALCVLLIVTPQNPINKHVSTDRKTNKVASKAADKTSPAIPANAPPNQLNSTSHSDQHDADLNNRVNRIEVVPQADWWFKGYVIATFCIAAVNIAVLIAVWRQKVVMSGQLGVMQKQVANAAEQVIAAQGTNQRMTEQLRIMQAANQQTNRLIEQTRASADAAKTSADAATKSADVFVESERARIHARLRHESGTVYYLEVINYGRTIAHITNIRFGVNCIVPYSQLREPYGDRTGQAIDTFIPADTQFHQIRDFSELPLLFSESDWPAITLGSTKQGIFFCAVDYRDILGVDHTSDVVYSYRIYSQRFEEMREHRKYT